MLENTLKITTVIICVLMPSFVLATENINEAMKRTAKINEFKALLQSPDPTLRLVALDTMQNSKDLAMREIGYSIGLNSSDQTITSLTIKNKFSEIVNFAVTLKKPEENEKSFTFYKERGGRIMNYIT